MASITIRNLDEATKQSLRERAARNGRSMEEEVRLLLRAASTATGMAPVLETQATVAAQPLIAPHRWWKRR